MENFRAEAPALLPAPKAKALTILCENESHLRVGVEYPALARDVTFNLGGTKRGLQGLCLQSGGAEMPRKKSTTSSNESTRGVIPMTARHTTSAMITPTLWASVGREQEGAVTGPCSQTGGKQASLQSIPT